MMNRFFSAPSGAWPVMESSDLSADRNLRASKTLTMLDYSTSNALQRHRHAEFRRALDTVCDAKVSIATPLRRSEEDPGWEGAIRGFSCKRFCALMMRFTPHTATRAHAMQRTRRMMLTIVKEGRVMVAQDGRRCYAGPGELFLVDPSRPFITETDHIVFQSVQVPKSALRALVPELDAFTARTFPGDTCAGEMVRVVADQMTGNLTTLIPEAIDLVVDSTLNLVAALLLSQGRSEAPIPCRRQLMQRHWVQRYISEHLHEPQLSPARIAKGSNLSIRSVYRLFDVEDRSLMDIVWTERLERCRRDLASPALSQRSIGEVATAWGFRSAAHFSRLFRGEFGCSPSEHRQEHAKPRHKSRNSGGKAQRACATSDRT
jgi:AraC family transcriptional activator of tynA and feaB